MKIARMAARRRQSTIVAQGAADGFAELSTLLGDGSAVLTVRGRARTRSSSGPKMRGKDNYLWQVTLTETELRDCMAQLHSLRVAHEDGGAKLAYQRPADGKRWEKPIVRELPISRTIAYRLDKAGQRRRAKRKATEGSDD